IPSSKSLDDTFFLYGASAPEFDAFLTVLLPNDYNGYVLTKEQWLSVLKLSTLWDFLTVRMLAIRHLTPLLKRVPLERLIVARTYNARNEWTESAIQELVERDEPLFMDEAAQLPWAYVVRIHQAREVYAKARMIKDLRKDPLFAKAFEEQERSRVVPKNTHEEQPKPSPSASLTVPQFDSFTGDCICVCVIVGGLFVCLMGLASGRIYQ
ncbi:hypothetical protein PENSPDRAFT_580331, partial [Peniophora sp. CONT]